MCVDRHCVDRQCVDRQCVDRQCVFHILGNMQVYKQRRFAGGK